MNSFGFKGKCHCDLWCDLNLLIEAFWYYKHLKDYAKHVRNNNLTGMNRQVKEKWSMIAATKIKNNLRTFFKYLAFHCLEDHILADVCLYTYLEVFFFSFKYILKIWFDGTRIKYLCRWSEKAKEWKCCTTERKKNNANYWHILYTAYSNTRIGNITYKLKKKREIH